VIDRSIPTRSGGSARVVFTDRHGGVSRAPYESANLAQHVGDDAATVTENRRLVAERLALVPPTRWVEVNQVHGREVVTLDDPETRVDADADAIVTACRDRPLVIFTADCAPIALVADGAVGAVHAGWGGLHAGVVERAVDALRRLTPGPITAVLGPCIHPERYEFGADLLDRMVAHFGPVVAGRTSDGTPAFDIPAAVRIALARAGVDEVDDVGVCTAASNDYFSYRRDGVTGRQAMFVVCET
jgi:YfiH family protein